MNATQLARLCIGLLLAATTARAAPPLPTPEALQRSVARAPEVEAARARVAEARHGATLLGLGPYEWSLSASAARRRVTGDGTSGEWDTALERPVRLPGKAALDRQLGQLQTEQALAQLAVTLRSSRVAVLDAWFACVQAGVRARLLEQERQYVAALTDAIFRRRNAGDLAELDAALATAELATVTAAASTQRVEAINAARLLATRMQESSCDLESWDEPPVEASRDEGVASPARQVETDPTVLASAAAAAQASTTAERARRERWPDPTLGVTYGRERDGAERIGGLSFSVPLGLRRRAAEAARADAAAAAAASEVAVTRAAVERQHLQLEADWQRAHQSWVALAEAERQQRRAAELSRRAFELGEASLPESLQVRRAAVQAQLAARAAELETWHMRAIRLEYSAVAPAADAAADAAPRSGSRAAFSGSRRR
jgi:outer membrane protein TolC